ncbi:Os01g0867800 [Oryza sativa Japonica Group]|uniref:Os01g0867800 protein n=1 Tax=Oryza sativa subsp. japonica TaxID=39947 RepID=A0A0N7KE46_ORYSJ|nr:hypothetical protein EE612_007027 [Oryza sativa]BAS75401.1 Os01g0867800 [Oryza sativa Japonica Group]
MAEPSKVIHIRNVGHEISESELLQVVQPFGTVAKLVMLRAKNQALVQMEDLASAVNVIQYYNTIQPSVRGRNVYLQYSSHQELTTDQSSHGRNPDQAFKPSYNISHVKVQYKLMVLYMDGTYMMVAAS